MLVVAAFIQQVMFEAKQRDDRLKELALKHCKLLQKVSFRGLTLKVPLGLGCKMDV